MKNGYFCDNSTNNNAGFCVKIQLRRGDYIESQYYNHKSGVKGNRSLTDYICEICYEDEYIVLAEEICAKRDIGGKNPLLVCRYYFGMNIEIPYSGVRTKQNQDKDQ